MVGAQETSDHINRSYHERLLVLNPQVKDSGYLSYSDMPSYNNQQKSGRLENIQQSLEANQEALRGRDASPDSLQGLNNAYRQNFNQLVDQDRQRSLVPNQSMIVRGQGIRTNQPGQRK